MRSLADTPGSTPESGGGNLFRRSDFVVSNVDEERTASNSATPNVRTTAEIAADSLTLKIFDGQFEPGTRLAEVALAEELGISRNTLREAFRLLAHAGLVVHLPNRGVFVLKTTPALLNDIYSFRRVVEVGALHFLEGNEHYLTLLRSIYAEQLSAIRDSNWMAVGSANGRFHQAIVDAAGSATLSEAMQTINARSRIAFLQYDDIPGLHGHYSKINGQLLSLMERGAMKDATELLDQYLISAHNELFMGLGFYKTELFDD